jgi:hypothetical protein
MVESESLGLCWSKNYASLQWVEIRSKDHKNYGSAANPYGTLYTHVVQCIHTRGTLNTHMRYPVYTHVVPCIYTCGTLYIHMWYPVFTHVVPCIYTR